MSTLEDVGAGGLLTGIVVTSGAYWLGLVRGGLRRHGAEHQIRDRALQGKAAVTEASLEAEWFAPEEIRGAVDEIFALAESVWRDGRAEASTRRDRSLIERWARSVLATLGEGVRPVREPVVDVLQVINRVGEHEDRIALRVRLRLRRAHHRFGEPRTVGADFRWTLGRVNRAWLLLSVDADPLAAPLRDRPFIVAEWADDARLREESLLELADADTVGPGVDLAGLISPDMPARQQLNELAQMDGRFDPDLLTARIAHIVEAWEEACTGPADPLAAVTSPEAFSALLHPASHGERRRLVIRDAELSEWEPTRLVLSGESPEIEISLTVAAVRFVVRSLDGTHVGGSVEARHQITLTWTLALTDSTPAAWALASTTNPADHVPGGR